MSAYKEIVTKAVIGKGKKQSTNKFSVSPEYIPNTILGCWVINNHFTGFNEGNSVVVRGGYDVNIWYSYDNDTKTGVSKESYNYEEKMNVKLKEESVLTNNSEIIVRSLTQPTVSNVSIEGNKVNLEISKELGIEIVGDTKVKVEISEEEDDYEIILDEEEVPEEVQEDYLN